MERLSSSFRIYYTLAEMGAARLWHLLKTESFVPSLGALTGNQAVQQVKAGLQAIYLSGWQVAADANSACEMTGWSDAVATTAAGAIPAPRRRPAARSTTSSRRQDAVMDRIGSDTHDDGLIHSHESAAAK